MFDTLSLKNVEPLVTGSRRYVFQHPREPGLLVKVLNSEAGKVISFGVPGLQIRRPNEMVRTFRSEISEYLRVRAKIAEGPLPMARVFGVVDTDIGHGLLVERIAGADGRLAPTLRTRVRERGLDPGIERLVRQLRDELIRLDVVAGDINTSNIVVGTDPDGAERLVIVDGLGDNTFLPVNSLSVVVNRRTLRRRFERIQARLRRIEAGRERPGPAGTP